MPKSALFDRHYEAYEEWFERHKKIYQTELAAIKRILPPFERGLEVGVGTGRFAAPLGIKEGVEPSEKMAKIAKKRGIAIKKGVAEELPYPDESFDLVLMVTTICFVDDPLQALKEAHRVLKPQGELILAFVDKESPLGKMYEKNRHKSRFYSEASFFDKEEILKLLKEAGFVVEECAESLFGEDLEHLELKIYEGCEKGGAFLVLRARKL
jgi:ubiquinone/menaquinone biosynthesis C-methylase UbiE